MKKALLVGASGLVGNYVLQHLLKNKNYEAICILSRRPLPEIRESKVQVIVVNFEEMKTLPAETFKVDDVFSCLGNTMLKIKNMEAYRRIEIDFPVMLAELTAAQGAKSFHYVSAIGASSKSSIVYSKMKGETEDTLKAIQSKYPQMSVCSYKPSFIDGPRKEFRLIERLLLPVFRLINPLLLGPFKKMRSLHAETIAKEMIARAAKPVAGFYLVEGDKIGV